MSEWNDMVTSVRVIQLRPNTIVEYTEWLYHSKKCHRFIEETDQEKAYSGNVTSEVSKRIKRAINLLIMSSPKRRIYNPIIQKEHDFQLAFLTLTVSAKSSFLTAKDGYDRLLSHFLQWMRRTKKVKSFVWKAELQQRGQIHYHITFNIFIPHEEIRKKWNELQRREGLLDEYFEEKNHYEPNSIDIHSVQKIENLAGYMVKYMAKDQDSDPVMKADAAGEMPVEAASAWGSILSCYPENTVDKCRTIGKVWDCSSNLKGLKYFNTVMNDAHEWTLSEAVKQGVARTVEGDSYKLHFLKSSESREILSENELDKYNEFIKSINTVEEEEVIN